MTTLKLHGRRGRRAVVATCLVAVAALATSACSDPFKLKASYANEPFTFSVFAMSGAGPANGPAALDLVGRTPVRVDGTLNFDIAFDVDGKGQILVIPQRLVGTPMSGSRTVGLQRITGSYESVLLAPQRGWLVDSIVRLVPGETVGVRMVSASCLYQLSNEMYAKVVIDSVRAGGLLYGRGVINPNCGFRSYATGIPDK